MLKIPIPFSFYTQSQQTIFVRKSVEIEASLPEFLMQVTKDNYFATSLTEGGEPTAGNKPLNKALLLAVPLLGQLFIA